MALQRTEEGYADSLWVSMEDKLVVIYFVISMFITQIVILNMLIAIMGATFGRHTEDQESKGKRQKLVL